METRRMTRSLREHQSAYEDRARVIQERITVCRDAFRDARNALGDLCPKDNDSSQRKHQLSNHITLNVLQLQAHAGVYDALVMDWDDLVQDYNIEAENSDWAESMRVQRAQFLSLTPHLAAQFQDLIATYEDYHRRVEGSASTEANVSTDTTASRSANGKTNPGRSPANSAGADLREAAATGVPDPANSAGMDDPDRTPTRPTPDMEPIAPAVQQHPARRVRIREQPTEIDEFGDLSLRSEAASDDEYYYDASPVLPSHRTAPQRSAAEGRTPTSTPLSGHRSPIARRPAPATHGLFAHTDGLVTNAAPMAWQNHHTGNGRHHKTRTYDGPTSAWTDHARAYDSRDAASRMPYADASHYAASAAPAARAANSAAGSAGNDAGSAYLNPSQPTRIADDRSRFVEHRDRLRHVLRDAKPPAGGGRYSAATSAPFDMDHAGPPPTARTTQPLDSSAYNRPRSPPPQPPPVDFGVDFARENASKFYQNGTNSRTAAAKPPPVVLKELPIQKFSGSYRAYPMFRNRFLETIGHRTDLEPRHKFQYLLQYLEGEPFNHANGYLLTDENYFKVLDHLEDRYGNQSTLVTLLSQDFVTMGNVASTSRDLRRFHDAVLRLADEMEQLGQDVNSNVMWRQTMFGKMPQTLRAKIFENLGKDPMTTPIREILRRISDYARILEQSEMHFSWTAPADRNSGRNGQLCRAEPRSTSHRTGTYAADADTTLAANSSRGRCTYCGRGHWSSQCTIYATIGQRVRRLRQLEFCFLCLRGGHWSAMCPCRTNEACKYCRRGQHHQSLCRRAYAGVRPPTSSIRPSPVSATTPGVQGLPKNEPSGGSSSAQDVRVPGHSVNRTDASGASPATLRHPSTHQRSAAGESNSRDRRRRKSKGPRTDPQGRNGTTRPTTACVDENVTQMDANACGSDGPLPDHPSHLPTDRRSNTSEMRCADWTAGASTGAMFGIPDVSWERVPSDEETSLPESTGHCSDAETEPPAEEVWADDPSWFATIDQDYSGYAVSTTSPADNHAVLLECLKTTAVNIDNGTCRSVIVFFDSGSNASYISMKLALELQLPCLDKRYFRVNTFGTDVTTTISGFATTLLLRSSQRYTIQLALTASDRIVPPVTTALVTTDEVAQLETSHCALISTRETPDLLIGQDLMHLFQRRFGPSLPNGFQVVWSCLGPMLGGAGKVAHNRRAATTINAATTSDPEPPSDATTTPPSAQEPPPPAPTQQLGYDPEDPLNLWTIDDPAPDPANSAGTETEASAAVPTNSAGAERDDSAVVDTTTLLCSLLENNDADLFGDFSRVENAGTGTSEMTPDDQAAADMLKKIHKRQPDGRYEVPLLFRTPDGEPPSNDDLPTNVALAKGRSFSTRKMLTAHPKKLLDYHSVILDWQARGFIKEAPKTKQYTADLHNLPSIATPRRPLFDPFELQMSRARQIMTAMNEKMRIWDGLFAKYRRCLELEAAGRPADRNYAQLDAEMMKRLGTPSFLAAALRADLQADQEAQTDLDIAHQEAQADADAIQQVIDAAWLQEQAAFWNDVQLTGTPARDDNPFLQEVAAEEEEAEPTEEAAPVARGPDPANSAGTVPALRPPANQVPFNSKALLRSKPIASDMPPFPSLDEIEHHLRQFFAMLSEGQEPPVLEPIDESRLYSIVAERAQKFCFIVNRNSLAPQTPTTWDPLVLCNGDGEQDCFHRSLRRLRIIQKPRWICGRLKNDAQLVADMNALLDRFVPSFGHMILLSYAVRMFNGSSNVYAYVDFLTRMLDCTDFDEDLPKLLADRQPYLVGRGTRDPWPTTQDLRTAAKRWTCYCQRAYRDIFTRLSGPILWSPEWMRPKDIPSAARTAFDKMATKAAVVLDAVRQMVYRQYGLKHIQAIRSNTAYEWLPLDNFSDRDLLAENGLLPSKTICFVDQYVFRDFGASLQPRIRLELLSDVDCASMLDTVMNKYPSHEVDRIIWWFGTEYIVDHEQDDYGTVVAFLSHHFATYFGYPEQIVIAPPYAHTRCDSWSMNVLGLLVQKPVLLPHARLIIAPHDLQLWRRDYFPTNAAEADETWPSLHLTETGLLRNPHVAELRKYQLNKYHGLDLWTYYEAFTPTAPMPQDILDRTTTGGPHGDFTEPGIVRVAANSAAPETPSTSTSSTTEATANSAVAEAPTRPTISATIAEQNPRVQDTRAATDAASPSVSPATPDAAPPSSADAPAIAAPTANLTAPVTIADVETRIAPLAADVAEMKDALLQIKAALLGPRAPTAPDTTTERDD